MANYYRNVSHFLEVLSIIIDAEIIYIYQKALET